MLPTLWSIYGGDTPIRNCKTIQADLPTTFPPTISLPLSFFLSSHEWTNGSIGDARNVRSKCDLLWNKARIQCDGSTINSAFLTWRTNNVSGKHYRKWAALSEDRVAQVTERRDGVHSFFPLMYSWILNISGLRRDLRGFLNRFSSWLWLNLIMRS